MNLLWRWWSRKRCRRAHPRFAVRLEAITLWCCRKCCRDAAAREWHRVTRRATNCPWACREGQAAKIGSGRDRSPEASEQVQTTVSKIGREESLSFPPTVSVKPTATKGRTDLRKRRFDCQNAKGWRIILWKNKYSKIKCPNAACWLLGGVGDGCYADERAARGEARSERGRNGHGETKLDFEPARRMTRVRDGCRE